MTLTRVVILLISFIIVSCEQDKPATTETEQFQKIIKRHKGHYDGYSIHKKKKFSLRDLIDASRQLREIQIFLFDSEELIVELLILSLEVEIQV